MQWLGRPPRGAVASCAVAAEAPVPAALAAAATPSRQATLALPKAAPGAAAAAAAAAALAAAPAAAPVAAAAPAAALAPSPAAAASPVQDEAWVQMRSSNGRVYFWSRREKASKWELPLGTCAAWTSATSSDGRTYYWNKQGRSVWKLPPLHSEGGAEPATSAGASSSLAPPTGPAAGESCEAEALPGPPVSVTDVDHQLGPFAATLLAIDKANEDAAAGAAAGAGGAAVAVPRAPGAPCPEAAAELRLQLREVTADSAELKAQVSALKRTVARLTGRQAADSSDSSSEESQDDAPHGLRRARAAAARSGDGRRLRRRRQGASEASAAESEEHSSGSDGGASSPCSGRLRGGSEAPSARSRAPSPPRREPLSDAESEVPSARSAEAPSPPRREPLSEAESDAPSARSEAQPLRRRARPGAEGAAMGARAEASDAESELEPLRLRATDSCSSGAATSDAESELEPLRRRAQLGGSGGAAPEARSETSDAESELEPLRRRAQLGGSRDVLPSASSEARPPPRGEEGQAPRRRAEAQRPPPLRAPHRDAESGPSSARSEAPIEPVGLAMRTPLAAAQAAPAPQGCLPAPSAPSDEEWFPAGGTDSEAPSPGRAPASPGRWRWRRDPPVQQDSFWGGAARESAGEEPVGAAAPLPLQRRRPAGGGRLAARLTPAARAPSGPQAPESVWSAARGGAAAGAVLEPLAGGPRGSGREAARTASPAATVFEVGQDAEALLEKFMVRARCSEEGELRQR
ncbi:unnamed protein product [Prorocentrum cordatum]|uniref:WW domain-containing protein n=1 Tax=Prorocentrum cordatum TaxID=2364126 RepID=A0ABN9SGS4_9DINO|nr:unnamed protein product [Polarella glacialis]